MRNNRGFTLLELMIVVVIIAIIGAVAFPSFLSSIRKGRRADAADAATAVLQAQERVRANSPAYVTSLGTLNVASTSANGYYTLSVGADGANPLSRAYKLTITPVSGKSQVNDTGCTSMTVTVTNGNPVYAPATCWSR
ncbi:MAG: prepilin-type N-terminal cleavage/methylation domain-containing protein [Burkholderiales bacterium]|nr:prepilin-type N-terminal cleavage/methylation domain-containing protein [Burkholderiales bacterium]